jgi:hypothetical protein
MRATAPGTVLRRLPSAVVVAAVLVACGQVDDGAFGPYPEEGAPFVEEVVVDRDQIATLPEAVVAGASFEVVFPGQATRGPGFVIERLVDEGWEWMWATSSDTDAREPSTPITAERFRDERGDWADGPAFDSTGPHRIWFPEDAELGRYRVCTAPDQPALCAEIEVVERLGLGRSADLPVEAADRIEVRQVLVDGLDEAAAAAGDDRRSADGSEPSGAEEHATPFGATAITLGALHPDDAAFIDLVAEVAQVHRIETGEVVYDLGNPDVEVVFLDGDRVLARLGYYLDAGSWGEYGVAGRWMDDEWHLLAMTTELPAGVLEPFAR